MPVRILMAAPLESNILFPDPFYYPADMNWYLGYWDDKDVAVVSLIYDPY